jgi:hypothetical protein
MRHPVMPFFSNLTCYHRTTVDAVLSILPKGPPMEHQFITVTCLHCGARFIVAKRCGNRFCADCNGSRRSRIRRHVSSIIEHVQLYPAYRFRFITLTIRSEPDLRSQYLALVAAFRRLRQRSWWRRNVTGGVSFAEVTFNQEHGWHCHLHLIVKSRFLPQATLSAHWQDCSGSSVVDIRLIFSRQIAGYVTKYATKSDLPEHLQLDASRALAGSRLFQPFGSWHGIANAVRPGPQPCKCCGATDWSVQLLHETLDAMILRSTVGCVDDDLAHTRRPPPGGTQAELPIPHALPL